MRPFHEISRILDERQLLTRFWQAASVFWRVQTGRTAMLGIFLIAVVLLQLLVQVPSICGTGTSSTRWSGRMPLLFGCRRNCLFHSPWGAFCWRRRQFGAA